MPYALQTFNLQIFTRLCGFFSDAVPSGRVCYQWATLSSYKPSPDPKRAKGTDIYICICILVEMKRKHQYVVPA